jgi:hypothetical protein
MKRALQAFWDGIVTRFLTLTAAIIVVMLCAVAFLARQGQPTAPAPTVPVDAAASATQPSPALPIHPSAPTPDAPAQPATAYEFVHGYKKKDGTVVQGYHRTKADGDKSNNWSEKGNVNPFTGKPGTQNP